MGAEETGQRFIYELERLTANKCINHFYFSIILVYAFLQHTAYWHLRIVFNSCVGDRKYFTSNYYSYIVVIVVFFFF